MNKLLKLTLALCLFTLPLAAHADEYGLATKSIDEFKTDTTSAASGDYTIRWDDSEREFKKIDATSLKLGSGTPGITVGEGDLYVTGTLEVDSTVNFGGSQVLAGTLTLNGAILYPDEDVTATNVLTVNECGKVTFLNSTTEFVSTLPTPTAGCEFKFIVKAAPSGASYTVVTNSSANVIIGGINELEVDTADDGPYIANGDTITFVDSVSVVGDYVSCISDGTSWYCEGQANADGGITLTQAS